MTVGRSWAMHASTRTDRSGRTSGALSFELFFEAERRRLFRALYLMTGSVQEAEEIAQDAFLKIWERWDRVGAMEDPTGYLYRAAMNLSRSHVRRLVRATKTSLSTEPSVDPYGAADARDAIVRAVAALSPRQRQALVLTELLDRSTGDAGKLMGVTSSTIRSLLSEARTAMRTVMESDDD